MSLFVLRGLRLLMEALIAFGGLWVPPPPPPLPAASPQGPTPGHPERLCPEIPLSEAELRLQRELSAWLGGYPG
ncbi:DUF6059 family protein [Streptomyces sp. NPDC057136]|uniref:DUF6059 family protein n=1 Tax=Streptomyces sp. NPDC057136 TaxID=3346029 RepID=UPI0036374148